MKYFKEFFTDPNFSSILINTLALSLLKLIFSFPIPIIFAIMITETQNMAFRRFVQTVSYLPHFISWVIVSGLVFTFFSVDYGVVNSVLNMFGKERAPFITSPDYYWSLAVFTDIWKDMGWWAIIFIAAITAIDPSLYEAAYIDGAGRIARIRYVVLPSLIGTITVVLILSMGSFLGGGMSGSNFEQSMLIGNNLNSVRSEIIQSYSLKMGLGQGRFSYGTAIGLLQSITSVILIFSSNAVSKKFTRNSLF
jgi:putative aldouronate transport system permease protein